MDELISQIVKFLSNTVVVRISSYPPFAIEIFLSTVVCIVHLLLIYEINTLVKRTNAKAAERLRARVPIKDSNGESCSFHSMVTLQTAFYQKKGGDGAGDPTNPPMFCVPFRKMNKMSAASNFGWVVSPRKESILKNNFNERVEHLLSISPSEYIRRDKERKNREAGLRSCLQSLTSLLEKALNSDHLDLNKMSKDDIRKSIQTIRDNFEYQVSDSCGIKNFPSPSLQSLIAKSTAKNALQTSLSPNLMQTVYHASTMESMRRKRNGDGRNGGDSVENICPNKSESFNEIFRKDTNEFYGEDIKNHSRIVLTT